MKKILISICLFTVWITSYSQINCNGTSASTVNPTDKLAICNGNLQRTVTASQLVDAGIDTTKLFRVQQGRGIDDAFCYLKDGRWVMKPDTGVNLKTFFQSLTIVSNEVTLDCQHKAFPIFFINDFGTDPLAISITNDYGVVEITVIIECVDFPLGLITLPVVSYPSTYQPLNASGRIVLKGSWSFGNLQWTIDETDPLQKLTSVYSANSDISVDSTVTGKRKLTLNTIKGVTITGSSTPNLLVVGTATVSGSNTGDQTSVIGNAGTATALQTARTIGTLTGDVTSAGSSFDGTANNTNSTTVTRINGTSLAGLSTGILKNTTSTGVPSIAVAGTDYQVPLTFSTGLTNTSNTITNNLLTGISGEQTIVGSTSTNSGLTYKATTGVGTTGANHTFTVGNNGATEAMRILNAGDVCIGTTSASSRLHVRSASLGTTAGNTSYSGIFESMVGNTASLQLLNIRLANGGDFTTAGTRIQFNVDNTNPLGFVQFSNNGIQLGTTSTTGLSPHNIPEVARFTNTGNMGIGTTTPQSRLDVYAGSLGGVAGNSVAIAQVGMPSTNAMYLQTFGVRTATGTSWRQAAIRQQLTVDASNGMSFIQFWGHEAVANTGGISFGTTQNSGDAPLSVPERMRITNTGNMGIGTTTPQSRLDVEGGLAVGSTYSGTTAAPPNGAIIEGSLGIGTVTPAAKLEVNGLIKYKTYIVSGLPTCNSGIQDQYATVTDAVAPTYLVTVVGGGAIHAPVFCNGTNWVTH